jgi:phage gp29-like protein
MAKEKQGKGQWGPHANIDSEKKDLFDTPDVNLSGGDHFATRSRANDFVRLMRGLPDPDPVLKKMGKGITALQELLTDSHLESVWGVRCAATSGAEWFMSAAQDGGYREQEAADSFAEELKDMDVPRIIEEMMDAVAYGYSPLEVLWQAKEGRWGIGNIVGKPPQWFEFNQNNNLVLKAGMLATEELPENRFLLVQHRPSYANPYGVKVFSKCFWPVTFKKNGFRWWTVFVEKYGGAFMYGKYPSNASEQFKDELLSALDKMVADAVAIAPEGSEITIQSAADKGGSSGVHQSYIQMANAEISKAVLGQTLTTEIGDVGSFAAASAHNLVREDIASADRRRISAAFNRLAAVYTFYNFGGEVAPPLFQFVKDEDLQSARAERDMKLHQMGWRPKKEYIVREYGMQEEDFELAEESSGSDAFPGFRRLAVIPEKEHPENCPCGCQDWKKRKSLFHRIALLFASKDEKELEQDTDLIERFDTAILKAAQEETNETVDAFVDAAGQAHNFEDVFETLGALYDRRSPARCADLVDEIRYAASQIGAKTGQKGGRRNG